MNFGVIGTGIVGTALAVRLEKAGHVCVGVHTQSRLSYEKFSNYLMVKQLSLEDLIPLVDWLLITTQDGMIRAVVESIASDTKLKTGQVWIHCSGSISSNVLRVNENLPAKCLAIHPLQAFASVENALAILDGTHFGIDGDDLELAEKIVLDLGGVPHRVQAAQKSVYHAGAVVASNYLVVLASLAVDLFEEAGINREEALNALLPLMKGTLSNLELVGLPQALTGPIARGDAKVVQGHIKCMPDKFVKIYRVLGSKALELGQSKKSQLGLEYPSEVLGLLKSILLEKA